MIAVRRILLLGYHPSVARLLSAEFTSEPHLVYLLEEPGLARPSFVPARRGKPGGAGLVEQRTGRYQQSDDYWPTVQAWHDETAFDAIMPGREYGVRASTDVADRLGLPHPGRQATVACTNKLVLRRLVAADTSIRQPRFAEVNSPQDVHAFMTHGGPVILKPANRHASLGVVRIERPHDAEAAWAHATSDEGPAAVRDRRLRWQYIVEDYLEGRQISVETIVHRRRPVFSNVTWVDLAPGPAFVETNCIVPAPLSSPVLHDLLRAQEALLRALDVPLGLFHSEWKLTQDGPALLECAARVPGSLLPEQIFWALDYNLCEAFAAALAGEQPRPHSQGPGRRVCGLRSIYAEPGEVWQADGADLLAQDPRVLEQHWNIRVGDKVGMGRSPWTYAVRYVVTGRTAAEVACLQAEIDQHLRIVTATDSRRAPR